MRQRLTQDPQERHAEPPSYARAPWRHRVKTAVGARRWRLGRLRGEDLVGGRLPSQLWSSWAFDQTSAPPKALHSNGQTA